MEELAKTLTKELEGVSDFFRANQLMLNAKKTKMVLFRKKSLPQGHQQINVILDGVTLNHDENADFLGTTIDGTLNWEKHCTKIANKISRSNGVLNRVKNLLPLALSNSYTTLSFNHTCSIPCLSGVAVVPRIRKEL